MDERIIEALNELDIVYNEIWSRRIGEQRNNQWARYSGLKDMFELLTGEKIDISIEGKHKIRG